MEQLFFVQFTKYLQKTYSGIFQRSADSIRSERLSKIGWHLSQKDIAKYQVFNQPNKTPMQSVFDTCVYDIFHFLLIESIESQEKKKHDKQMRSKKK